MKTIVAILLVSAGISVAHAQGTDEQKGACMGDAFKFCGAFIPDETAIEKCLEAQLPNLTPACRSQFTVAPVAPAPKGKNRRQGS